MGIDISPTTVPSLHEQISQEKPRASREEVDAVVRLVGGQPTRIYHRVQKPEDIIGVQENGIRGNYKSKNITRPDGLPYYISYFNLIPLADTTDRDVFIEINTDPANQMKIYYPENPDENKTNQELIEKGYDGSITTPGQGVPLGRYFMLKLFDGASLAGKFQKSLNT